MRIREEFKKIEDKRHPSYVCHKLSDICIIIMCATLCGIDNLEDLNVYAHEKEAFFKKNFEITKIPSKSTFCRILRMIDAKEVGEIVIRIMKERVDTTGEIIAIDGKTIRSTGIKGKPGTALQILTAYETEAGIVLGQEKIHKKTNEIPVFQEMLNYLNIKGKIITADAMHCQKETCRKIIEKKGNYVFGLKKNQKAVYEEVELFINDPENQKLIETYESPLEKEHGRIEKRICRKIKDISWVTDDWCGLKSVFAVQRICEEKNQKTNETNYYISSLEESPEKLMKVSREHWKIESLHWMLDVVFSEDDCLLTSEEAQISMNSFRKLSLALHKNYLKNRPKKSSLKSNMLRCLLDHDLLLALVRNL